MNPVYYNLSYFHLAIKPYSPDELLRSGDIAMKKSDRENVQSGDWAGCKQTNSSVRLSRGDSEHTRYFYLSPWKSVRTTTLLLLWVEQEVYNLTCNLADTCFLPHWTSFEKSMCNLISADNVVSGISLLLIGRMTRIN